MKIRIKFEKSGRMVYLGHLDIMRFFQKAIRRADIDISYTQGFNPHQKMSFSAPLSLGIESKAEYMDLVINSLPLSEGLVEKLQKQMVEGIKIVSATHLPDESESAMSVLAAADYEVEVKDPLNSEIDFCLLEAFYAQNEINTIRKTKKSEKEIDIKPLILSLNMVDKIIQMTLVSGSEQNLKPELVMKAFFAYINKDYVEHSIRVKRTAQYAKNMIPLENMGLLIN